MRWRCSGDHRSSGFRAEAVESCFSQHFPPRHPGVMMVKSPRKRSLIPPRQERAVLEHRYQSVQRSSLSSPWPASWACEGAGHPSRPLAVKPPGAPMDPAIRALHTGCWPSSLPCTLVLSPMTSSSPWAPSLSAFFPRLLGCPLPSWLCFLLQLLWLFLWLSLTARSQPTPWSFCPWQLRTKLPLDQTPTPCAHVAPKAGFLQCFSHGWAGKLCGGLYSSSSRVGDRG